MSIHIRLDGTTWAHQLGAVNDITWTDLLDTGSTSAPAGKVSGGGGEFHVLTFSIPSLGKSYTHPALYQGVLVELFDGTTLIGKGVMSEPDRTTWSFTVVGLNQVAANYPCLKSVIVSGIPTLVPTTIPDTVIAWAITQGLPWRLPPGGISTTPVVTIGASPVDDNLGEATFDAGIRNLKDLLDICAANAGKRWWLDKFGVIRMAADDTNPPKWAFIPDSVLMGTADPDYVSDVFAIYTTAINTNGDITATAVSHAQDVAAENRFGFKGVMVNLMPLGLSNATTADANTAARLAGAGARMGFTNTIQTDSIHLQTLGGTGAPLRDVRKGDRLRLYGTDDINGNRAYGLYKDVLINGVTHNTDGTITIEPIDYAARDFEGFVADAVAPDTTAA